LVLLLPGLLGGRDAPPGSGSTAPATATWPSSSRKAGSVLASPRPPQGVPPLRGSRRTPAHRTARWQARRSSSSSTPAAPCRCLASRGPVGAGSVASQYNQAADTPGG